MPDKTDTVAALVLPEDAVSSSEPQSIANFPGRWYPGRPYLPEALGLTHDEAVRLLKAVPTPLVWVDVDEASGTFTRADGHVPSGAASVELERAREARQVAEPVTTDNGDVVHPGFLRTKTNNPAWVDAQIKRDTLLNKGRSPESEAARTTAEAKIRAMTKPELDDLAVELGLDKSLKKADLVERVVDEALAALDRPDVPPTAGLVRVDDESSRSPMDGTSEADA